MLPDLKKEWRLVDLACHYDDEAAFTLAVIEKFRLKLVSEAYAVAIRAAFAEAKRQLIVVPELGESEEIHGLSDEDIELIQDVGAGKAGAVFPTRPSGRRPLLEVVRTAGGGVRVKARATVGFVPLSKGRVLQVRSKLGSDTGVFWLLFHALNQSDLLVRWTQLPSQRSPLEWVFLLFREEVRKLVQVGLRKDYVPVEETSGVARGRILPARTIAETRGLAHRVTCLYDDFTPDTFDNQVLRLTLRAAAHHASDDIRQTLLGTDALFDGEVSFERADLGQTADKLQRLLDQKHPGRANYVPAHSLALLILRLLSAGGNGRTWRQPGILLDMSKLFEIALKNILETKFGKGNFNGTFQFDNGVSLAMKPDVRLPRLLVDAKYKLKPLLSRTKAGPPGLPLSNDLYQAYTYSSFGKRPCALVYAVGDKTDALARTKLAPPGCPQTNAIGLARVGLFSLDISGNSFDRLNSERDRLIEQLGLFETGAR